MPFGFPSESAFGFVGILRLAQEWKIIDRVPRIRMLKRERHRAFVLDHKTDRLSMVIYTSKWLTLS